LTLAPPTPTLLPYTTLFRSVVQNSGEDDISVRTSDLTNEEEKRIREALAAKGGGAEKIRDELIGPSLGSELRNKALIALGVALLDRKSTRLNSSHVKISYAV